jgi:ATP-dependent DNA helicase RecG
MTATPIPRSLALTFYGDLELSVLDEMPKGRIPIGTAVVPESHVLGMYDHICTEIENGRQVYVVCPLIDPSDNFGARSVVEISKEIKKSVLNKFKSEVLHGKLASKDKEKIITDFKNGKIDILISTTVIEVGVDVPNATVMVIVNAERFGLAQLHQLRGRVGRSVMQSYCYLLPGDVTENSMERLRVLESTNDGFEVAEKDLLLRGPGNIFGNAQSGLPDFKLATINDFDLMKNAKKHTEQILNIGIDEFPLVENKIDTTFEKIHLE